MCNWLRRLLPLAGGMGFLLLLIFSLRPLGFSYHYSAHLLQLRVGRVDSARVSVFRAAHFNPVPVLLRTLQKEKIMDAVLIQAVRNNDVSQIRDYTSPLFPMQSFRKRYAGNPWFKALVHKGTGTVSWRRLGEIGFPLMSDSRGNAGLFRYIGKEGTLPAPLWRQRLAVVADLQNNTPLALWLDPLYSLEALTKTIRNRPARVMRIRANAGRPRRPVRIKLLPAKWRLLARGNSCRGVAGFVQVDSGSAILLAAPEGCRGIATGALSRGDPGLPTEDFLLGVDYLADLDGGKLEIRAGRDVCWKLPSTGGQWSRMILAYDHRADSRKPLRLVLRGGGLVVFARFTVVAQGKAGGDNG